jgi:hypothetical protein
VRNVHDDKVEEFILKFVEKIILTCDDAVILIDVKVKLRV